MVDRFIELLQYDDMGPVLIEPENVVAIQERPLSLSDASIGPRSFVCLRNSNILFAIADTVENIRQKIEREQKEGRSP